MNAEQSKTRRRWVRSMRRSLWQAGYRHCYFCRRPLVLKTGRDDALTVEHLQPRCRGGGDEPDNIVSACPSCNNAKGAIPAEVFMAVRHDAGALARAARIADEEAREDAERRKAGAEVERIHSDPEPTHSPFKAMLNTTS